jgi:transcriptional regulator with XRE-family HTH domain
VSGQRWRLDGPALHKLLDAKRRERGLSWRGVGRDLGVSFTTFSRLLNDDITITADSLVSMLVWLDLDTDIAYMIRPRDES